MIQVNYFYPFKINLNLFLLQDLFIIIEADSFGHHFKRAVARFLTTDINNTNHQEFLIELEGSQSLRFLLYQEESKTGDDSECGEKSNFTLKGKVTLDLTSSYTSPNPKQSEIQISDVSLSYF